MATETTHRATQDNGPSVVNAQLVWTSASGITTADPNSYGGCLRRWWYEKVDGKEAPTTDAMRGGTALHTEIEARLKTGSSLMSPLALAGGHYVPHPGQGLLIEQPIHFVTAGNVHIFGHVDLYNTRQEYIDPDGVLQRDPPWSFEVKDWKTTSDFQYAKSERELAENIQLNTYSEAGFRSWPDMEWSRHTHVYFRTRGAPRSQLVTIRRSREEVALRWEYAESVVRSMADISRETSAEHVTPNPASCNAYRGCPHHTYCTAYHRTSLDSLYTKIATDFTKEPDVGLLASNPQILNQQPAQQQAPQTQAPQPDMRAQIAAEDAQMRQQVAAAQRPSLLDAWARIIELAPATGRSGFPALGGKAAYEMGTARGYQMGNNQGFAGAGALSSVQLMTVDNIYQLLGELETEHAAQQPAQLPPVVQQAPVQTFTQQVAQAYNAQAYTQQTGQPIPTQQPVSFLPPGAPTSMPQLAVQQPAQVVNYTQPIVNAVANLGPAPEEPKASRGRPKKNKSQEAAPEATAAVTAPVSSPSSPSAPVTQAPPVAASTTPTVKLEDNSHVEPTIILINARLVGKASKSLADYVDYINAELSKRYSVNDDGSPGVQDVRCAPKGSILAFGGWKGAVREVVKSGNGLNGLEGAVLHLDTFMDELNEAVADALRVVADQKGWMYIRSVRG
jgi:hypothetical protein